VEGKFIVAGCAECGRWVHTVAAHPEDFLMPRNEPRRQGRPGEGCSHGCYTREPTRSCWDAGVPPRIMPITCTGYPSILGIPGRPSIPD